MNIVCYSERILNPFRGVMNIITTGKADAVTIDGIHWDLYIHNTFHAHKDEPDEFSHIDMPDIRYGVWCQKKGLVRAPALPSYHYEEIQKTGNELMRAIHRHAFDIPFAFMDDYELWLLDEENHEPLALLDSVCSEKEIHTPGTLQWQAGNRCREYFKTRMIPVADEDETHADLLNKLVNARAGNRPAAQWFLRKQDGYGLGMTSINLGEKYTGRELSPRLFPRMFVEQQWSNESASALFDEFIHWLSPWLLLMDFLKDSQREAFESIARQQAMLVDEIHLLYPKVISQKDINAARVEAAFRKSAPEPEKDDDPLACCYIEV